ncbi:TonB family protein [Mucilaginibacter arboris]|uniref:TonB family protein n=1 Tax=Mucilaginibacter arboris TaxID=2682090 RepID=A0A7K1SRV5_9SPHI|nr:TonB family protein [Mucilaginibacter arboris]MVN20031.1 TonB family protein [Mucilaginibacter arboris]
MNWWHYLILANLYLALFYGFYLLLLRKETYFMLNRIYLVSAALLSFFIPMMQAEWVKNLFITQKVQQTIYYIDPGFVYRVSPATESGFTISQFFSVVYWAVAMLLLARLFYRFVKLKRYMQSEENGSAFSFFGKIKVDENLPQKDVILQHERVHAIQFHSADVLLFEVLAILNWFNPVIYFYRKAIKYIHEFIADRNALSFGVDKSDYALLLLSQTMNVQPNTLTNSFFNHSLLKQRIMMLHKNPSRRSALLKYGLSAPLFVAMLILTSATVSEQKTIRKISDKISSDATLTEVAQDISKQASSLAEPASTEKSRIKTASTLKGKVVNVNGDPLANVKVSYAKKGNSANTNQEGSFKLTDYTEGDLLTFELVGYVTITTSFSDLKNKTPLIILLDMTRVNKLVAKYNFPSTTDSSIVSFAAVEKLPTFPGGQAAFGNYLSKAIRYPKEAKDQKTQGRVIVSFIVEKDGKLNNIKVLRDIGGGCGEEAIRVLSESPDWIPGTQNGKPVRVAYTMPINFSFTNGNNETTTYGKTTVKRTVRFMNEDSVIKRAKALNMNIDNMTMSGFGGKDSARQRPPADVVRIQSKIMGIDPIYLLDGKEIDKDVLVKINPNDIENISVWNGATATAKYGDKGKNGVVEITTKKGKKATDTSKP